MNESFVSKGDFLDLFEQTGKRIANERSEAKREAYKNILVTGITSKGYDYDDVENQIRLLDRVNSDHLLLLRLFNSPLAFTSDQNILNVSANTYRRLFNAIFPCWGHDYLIDILSDLENLRLIDPLVGNLHTMMTSVSISSLDGKLTSRGKIFVMFILSS